MNPRSDQAILMPKVGAGCAARVGKNSIAQATHRHYFIAWARVNRLVQLNCINDLECLNHIETALPAHLTWVFMLQKCSDANAQDSYLGPFPHSSKRVQAMSLKLTPSRPSRMQPEAPCGLRELCGGEFDWIAVDGVTTLRHDRRMNLQRTFIALPA